MNRRKEITNDLWDIFRKVYSITEVTPQSDKQTQLLDNIVEYIDTNLSTRRKRVDNKETQCLKNSDN
jgi:hypothetical protein